MDTTKKVSTPAMSEAPAPASALAPAATSEVLDQQVQPPRLEDLNGRAQQGDLQAWRDMQPVLAKIPDWETRYESPAVYARRALLEMTVGGNTVVQAAWERRVLALITELDGVDPSPLEHTLCERVATCWLETALAEATYAARAKGDLSFAAGEYFQKMQDRAHKRYLSACLALAKVRRLLAPVTQQVNIAEPGAAQVNIATPAQLPSVAAGVPTPQFDTSASGTVEADR